MSADSGRSDFDSFGPLLMMVQRSKNWKRMVFTLQGSLLTFFNDENCTMPLGIIQLSSSAVTVEILDAPPKNTEKYLPALPITEAFPRPLYSFFSLTAQGKQYYFALTSQNERDEWYEDISLALEFPHPPEYELKTSLVACAATLDIRQLKRILKQGMVDVNDEVIHNGNTGAHETATWIVRPLEFERTYRCLVLLRRYGASFNTQNNFGSTPLHLASKSVISMHKRSFKYLLDNGAGVDVPDVAGYTPIGLAVKNRNFTFLKMMIPRSSNVDALVPLDEDDVANFKTTSSAEPPKKLPLLHYSIIFWGAHQVTKYLLSMGSNPSVVASNDSGDSFSAFDVSRIFGRTESLSLLMSLTQEF